MSKFFTHFVTYQTHVSVPILVSSLSRSVIKVYVCVDTIARLYAY